MTGTNNFDPSLCERVNLLLFCCVSEEERIVSEERAKFQALKDELRDKTHRVNELEVLVVCF